MENTIKRWWDVIARVIPTFRNPDKYQVLKWRDWGRKNLPTASNGMVLEDLDLVALTYGALVQRPNNADGKFRLIEIKEAHGEMGYAQKRVFGLMHKLFRQADPQREYYDGFYLVRWNDDFVIVNGTKMDMPQFKEWMIGKLPYSQCPLSLFDNRWN